MRSICWSYEGLSVGSVCIGSQSQYAYESSCRSESIWEILPKLKLMTFLSVMLCSVCEAYFVKDPNKIGYNF